MRNFFSIEKSQCNLFIRIINQNLYIHNKLKKIFYALATKYEYLLIAFRISYKGMGYPHYPNSHFHFCNLKKNEVISK